MARMEEGRGAFKLLTGKPTGKKVLGSTKPRWEDNIRMNFIEIGVNTHIVFIRLITGNNGEPFYMRH